MGIQKSGEWLFDWPTDAPHQLTQGLINDGNGIDIVTTTFQSSGLKPIYAAESSIGTVRHELVCSPTAIWFVSITAHMRVVYFRRAMGIFISCSSIIVRMYTAARLSVTWELPVIQAVCICTSRFSGNVNGTIR